MDQNSLLLKQRMVDATWYAPSLTVGDNRDVEWETDKERVGHPIQLCEISVCLSGARVGKEACLKRTWNLKALNFYHKVWGNNNQKKLHRMKSCKVCHSAHLSARLVPKPTCVLRKVETHFPFYFLCHTKATALLKKKNLPAKCGGFMLSRPIFIQRNYYFPF